MPPLAILTSASLHQTIAQAVHERGWVPVGRGCVAAAQCCGGGRSGGFVRAGLRGQV